MSYADGANVAVECQSCAAVILDFDRPEAMQTPDGGDEAPSGNRGRSLRAASALRAYWEAGGAAHLRPGGRAGEEEIADLLCDLRHLADEIGLDWAPLVERAGRYHEAEAARHVVEVTGEGYQVLDTSTDALRADVWSSRGQAQDACDELNGSTADAARGD
ncbi:MAG: hypothetical protein JST59_29590 [Actinobacteria bacterium]|nr:hypothetical protein [Actinomycetota bacterium]